MKGVAPGQTTSAEVFDRLLTMETDDCIIWPRGTDSANYGMLCYGGKQHRAHRLALLHTVGPPPRGKNLATHGPCHNNRCMNPRHLSWGDYRSNSLDMRRDGTAFVPEAPRGTAHHAAKITQRTAEEIRETYAAGGTSQRSLAARHGLSQATIYDIIHFHIWKAES